MSKANKSAKHKLEQIFGKKDMFVAAEIEAKLEILKIRSYKKFENEQKFKGVSIHQQLTFHHLRHRKEGGDASIYNGALIGYSHHQYIHSLPREEEEIVNDLIREWKINFVIMQGNGEIVESGEFVPDFSNCITIPLEKNVKRKKYMQKKYPSRASKKREMQRLIKEEEEEQDIDFEI